MEQDKLWAKFTRTGKVADYLEYCGVDVGTAVNALATDTPKTQEAPHEADHRRADHPGKQQYR